MKSAKAVVGGVTMAATEVLMYFLEMIPVIKNMPPDKYAALSLLVQSGLVALAVYKIPNSDPPKAPGDSSHTTLFG